MPTELTKKSLRIKVSKTIGDVSALFYSPARPDYVMVFAHGAGANMKNKFMEAVSLSLAEKGIATLRFNFPYMEKGRKVPDTKPVCAAAISAATDKAAKICPGLPIFAGGKSFGGRMTSTAASMGQLQNISSIIFFGFPLHPPGKPSDERAEHLFEVKAPMLFLQGSRDALASLELLKPVCKKLGKNAELFVIEGADHSFKVPKSSTSGGTNVIELLCDEVRKWMDGVT